MRIWFSNGTKFELFGYKQVPVSLGFPTHSLYWRLPDLQLLHFSRSWLLVLLMGALVYRNYEVYPACPCYAYNEKFLPVAHSSFLTRTPPNQNYRWQYPFSIEETPLLFVWRRDPIECQYWGIFLRWFVPLTPIPRWNFPEQLTSSVISVISFIRNQ